MKLRDISVGLVLLVVCVSSKSVYKGEYYRYYKSNEIQSGPPDPHQAAQMARYIVHYSDWASVATISSMTKVKGFPFANTLSVSDGLVANSSGVPFLYLTPIEMTSQDLMRDSRCSLSMSLAQSDYCKHQNYDPQDPRCAHVILTGKIQKLKNGTAEFDFAKEALFTRHPIMKTWPTDHDWFFAKLKIAQICLMDYFGGPKFVKLEDYFKALPDSVKDA